MIAERGKSATHGICLPLCLLGPKKHRSSPGVVAVTDHAADRDRQPDPTVTRLVEEIRRRRKEANLSHAQLAGQIGYSRQYISLAERATKGLPSAELVNALDSTLGAEGALIALRQQAVAARFARRRRRTHTVVPASLRALPGVPSGSLGIGVANGRLVDGEMTVAAPPGRFFAGSTIQARMYPAVDDGRVVTAVPHGFADDPFLRHPRRGLVVGMVSEAEDVRLYGLDTRHARRRLDGAPGSSRLFISRAYALDDLTLGVLWAVSNLDEALLNDDAMLAVCGQNVSAYEQLPRSAGAREIAADLTPVSHMWLGSSFCANHILRHADSLSETPMFWTREQRGEEASTWLFFAHKYEYLRQSAQRFSGGDSELTRAFCVPPAVVAESSPAERILLLLAVALMESFGIRADICDEPEYAAMHGFVLDRRRRAIVANWVGTDGIWQVDVTDSRADLREYDDAASYARAQSVIRAATPADRLKALAVYLNLDWSWLSARCRELGEYGGGGIAEPCSRLLSLAGLDQACNFVGAIADVNP